MASYAKRPGHKQTLFQPIVIKLLYGELTEGILTVISL